MAEKGNPVCGGVTLFHSEYEGKHSYEVKGFLNHNKGMFISKGDKILMINNRNVEDLTPETLADLLVEGSPLLTIHHPYKKKSGQCESEELCVNKKEQMVMSFSLSMVSKSELEAGVHLESSDSDWEEEIEDDCFDDDNLLIVSMDGTSYSQIVARGCDPDNPCYNCGMTTCQLRDVVVLPAKAEITPNASKTLRFNKEKTNLFLKSFIKEKYVTPYNRQICLNNTMSAPITIYSYRVNSVDTPGVPVVLNFTGTDNFFSCTTKQGADTKILTVVPYDKQELKRICADDKEKWSLVFYMSCHPDTLRCFESALHRGWFIYTQSVGSEELAMHRDDHCDNKPVNTFFFIIENGKGSC